MTTRTELSLLKTAPATPVMQAVVPEAAVAHDADGPLRLRARNGRGGGERHAVAEDRIALAERREGRERSGSRCRPRRAPAPSRCFSSFMAENTGRSGQPVQNVGRPRRQRRAERLVDFGLLRVDLGDPRARAARRGAAIAGENAARPLPTTSGVYSPAIGSMSLPCSLRVEVGLAQDLADRLLDEIGRALLDDQHGASCRRRSATISSGTSGCVTLSTSVGSAHVAVDVAQARQRQAAVQHIEQAALHDDADVAVGRARALVELVVDDELAAPPAAAARSCRPPGGRSPADGSGARS